jgi:hypothetical protein
MFYDKKYVRNYFLNNYVHESAKEFWRYERYRQNMLSKLYAKSPYFLYNVIKEKKENKEEEEEKITFVHGGLINLNAIKKYGNMREYIEKEQAYLIENIKTFNEVDLFSDVCTQITTTNNEFSGYGKYDNYSVLWNRHIENLSKDNCELYSSYEPNTTFVVGHCQTTTIDMGNPRKDCHHTNKYGKLNCIYPTCFHKNSDKPAAIMTDVALSSAFQKKISLGRKMFRNVKSLISSPQEYDNIFEILLIKIKDNDFKFFSVRKEPSGIIETPLLNPALLNKSTGGFPQIIKSTKKTNIGVTNKNKKKHRSVSKSKTVRYHRKRQHRNKSKKKHNKTN